MLLWRETKEAKEKIANLPDNFKCEMCLGYKHLKFFPLGNFMKRMELGEMFIPKFS